MSSWPNSQKLYFNSCFFFFFLKQDNPLTFTLLHQKMTSLSSKTRICHHLTPPWSWWMSRGKKIPGISLSSKTLGSSGQVRQRCILTCSTEHWGLQALTHCSACSLAFLLSNRAGHKGEGFASSERHCQAGFAARTPLPVHLLSGRPQLCFPTCWR